MHWEKSEGSSQRPKSAASDAAVNLESYPLTLINYLQLYTKVPESRIWWYMCSIVIGHKDLLTRPFLRIFTAGRWEYSLTLSKRGKPSTLLLECQVLLSCLLGKIWSNWSCRIFSLCNWWSKRLETSCQIYHSLLGKGWKRIKAFRPWLLDLSLYFLPFGIKQDRAQTAQCLTAQSPLCTAPMRSAFVCRPQSSWFRSSSLFWTILWSDSKRDWHRTQHWTTGIVIWKLLAGLAQKCLDFRNLEALWSIFHIYISIYPCRYYPGKITDT